MTISLSLLFREGQMWEHYEAHYIERNKETYLIDGATHKVSLPDAINGGMAQRVYVEVKPGARRYYVIDSRGRIVLNGSPDPTILYNQYYGGPCQCQGECTCKGVWNPGRYDGDRGPTRL